jgi:hypothetical protein
MSIFIIGAWFWASLGLSAVAVALIAAFIAMVGSKAAPALRAHVANLGDSCRAFQQFQEPVPSSPSHRRPL